MKDLIESLQIFLKYTGDMDYPTHCEHDVMYCAHGFGPEVMSEEDVKRLDKLGWHWDGDDLECWLSFKFGSA